MSSSEAPPRAAELGFWFRVGCLACLSVYILSFLEKEPYLGDVFGSSHFHLRGSLGSTLSGAAAPRALRGRSGCTGGGRSREGARRKRQGVPAAKQNNTGNSDRSPYT